MTRFFTLLLTVLLSSSVVWGQTHRVRFKYRLSYKKTLKLATNPPGMPITNKRAADEATRGNIVYLACKPVSKFSLFRKLMLFNRRPFKCLITPDKDPYTLNIDGWQITANASSCNSISGSVDVYAPDNSKESLPINPITDAAPAQLFIYLPKRPNLKTLSAVTPGIHYQSWILTANSILFKVRPKVKVWDSSNKDEKEASKSIDRNVLTAVNLGLSAGYSFGWTKFTHRSANSWSITPSAALGFSAEAVKDASVDTVGLKSTAKNLVLSPSASVIIARNDIGLIFSYGWEQMVGRFANSWAYQGKPFWGLGLSAGFKL